MKIISYSELGSTNSEAKRLSREVPPWTIIVAEKQTSGYGKKKKSWFSPIGGLYLSIILPPKFSFPLSLLNLATGIALIKVLKKYYLRNLSLKWPNDVRVREKKIAGILSENIIGKKLKSSIVGIGLNTNINYFPRELQKKATSLKKELKREIKNRKIIESILRELKKVLKMSPEKILKEYRKYENTLEKEVTIITHNKKIKGKAFDFDQEGNLILKLKNNKLKTVYWGEIV